MDHADFTDVFRGGRFRSEEGTLAIEVRALGKLIVRSGRITVCDPLAPSVILDLARAVPKGEHPVEVAVARSGKDRRVAVARVSFAKGKAARWEMATSRGQNPKKLAPGEFYGYGVDAGTGCFVDTKTFEALEEETTGDAILAALGKTRVNTWAWANLALGKANVVAFSSGYGDGFYASYWGFDAKGKLVALVTDFGLMTEPIEETVLLPVAGPFKHPKLKSAGAAITTVKGKGLELRVRGDAEVSLVTSKGKPIPAKAERNYTDRDYTIAFAPKSLPKDAHVAIRLTLGMKPLVRVGRP